jgi:hypothetical protein
MTRYATKIYRFNYLTILWPIYGGASFLLVAVSANMLYNYWKEKVALPNNKNAGSCNQVYGSYNHQGI